MVACMMHAVTVVEQCGMVQHHITVCNISSIELTTPLLGVCDCNCLLNLCGACMTGYCVAALTAQRTQQHCWPADQRNH